MLGCGSNIEPNAKSANYFLKLEGISKPYFKAKVL